MVLTVSFVLSPVIGLLVTVVGAIAEAIVAGLMPASRHQDHTTSPSDLLAFVWRNKPSIASRKPNVRDDRETPLLSGTGRAERCW
jgi:hypothetical protein